jgi:hypothetical protein
MKNRVIVALLLLLILLSPSYSQILEFNIIPSKSSYEIGEVKTFSFEITNKSGDSVHLLNNLDPNVGYLEVFISKKGESEFKKYVGPWDKEEPSNRILILKLNDRVKNTVTIFFNAKPGNLHSSSEEVRKYATEGKILSDYAFPEAGIYYLKAIYHISLVKQRERLLIESEPIEIKVEEPGAEDLQVWNKVKDNRNIAYLIHVGDFLIPNYKTKEREKLNAEIEQIVNNFPCSIIANQIRKSFETFQIKETKRKASLEKLKKPE